MDRLHNAFLEDRLTKLYKEGAEVICAKLKEQGITLTPAEREKLVRYLKSESAECPPEWEWWESLQFDESDLEEIQEHLLSPPVISRLAKRLAVSTLEELQKQWEDSSHHQAQELSSSFRDTLQTRWGKALDRLRMLLWLSREIGAIVSSRIRDVRGQSSPNLADVLPRLHARACQITDEIVCLLDSGFADGAMARWRTLHEVASVAILIAENGEGLATRYKDHQVMESYRAAKDYRACHKSLGYEPFGKTEYDKVCKARKKMIARYGGDFDKTNGWASKVIQNQNPTIRDIEKAAGLKHLRAHYRLASHNVHANPKGVFFKLGLLGESDVLLAGPSGIGLTDAGHPAAISLMQVTAALGSLEPNLDSIVWTRVLGLLVDEIGKLFLAA